MLHPIQTKNRSHANLIDAIFDDFSNRSRTSWTPQIEIIETEKSYILKMNAPGISPEQLEISIKDGVLTVKGERKDDKQVESDRVHFSEFSYGCFVRSFDVGDTVNVDDIQASYNDGVLRIELAKKAVQEPKKIKIEVSK